MLTFRWYRAEAGSNEFKKVEEVTGRQYAVLGLAAAAAAVAMVLNWRSGKKA